MSKSGRLKFEVKLTRITHVPPSHQIISVPSSKTSSPPFGINPIFVYFIIYISKCLIVLKILNVSIFYDTFSEVILSQIYAVNVKQILVGYYKDIGQYSAKDKTQC